MFDGSEGASNDLLRLGRRPGGKGQPDPQDVSVLGRPSQDNRLAEREIARRRHHVVTRGSTYKKGRLIRRKRALAHSGLAPKRGSPSFVPGSPGSYAFWP
jgi:hypothetical protein